MPTSQVIDATAELAPDRKGFFLTFIAARRASATGSARSPINSQLRNLTGTALLPDLQLSDGDWYDGDAVEPQRADAIEDDVHSRGYAFVDVKPRVDRDPDKHTVNLIFDVGEGPRVYVERIDIVGNTRTEDKVIRREFQPRRRRPVQRRAVRRTRQRLKDLNYFSKVDIMPTARLGARQGCSHHHGRGEGDRRTDLRRRLLDRRRRAARRRPAASTTWSAPASPPASTACWRRRTVDRPVGRPTRISSTATWSPAPMCS